jgi:hypothetical protein
MSSTEITVHRVTGTLGYLDVEPDGAEWRIVRRDDSGDYEPAAHVATVRFATIEDALAAATHLVDTWDAYIAGRADAQAAYEQALSDATAF